MTEATPPTERPASARALRDTAVVLTLAAAGFLAAVGFGLASRHPEPRERAFSIVARKYGYSPSKIFVHKGDTVKLTFTSMDVVHGFYLEGYDLDVTILPLRSVVEVRHPSRPDAPPELLKEVVFKADREGKFRYRCSQTCGYLHPFMLGEMIVGPNRLLPTGIAMMVGIFAGCMLGALWWTRGPKQGPDETA